MTEAYRWTSPAQHDPHWHRTAYGAGVCIGGAMHRDVTGELRFTHRLETRSGRSPDWHEVDSFADGAGR